MLQHFGNSREPKEGLGKPAWKKGPFNSLAKKKKGVELYIDKVAF